MQYIPTGVHDQAPLPASADGNKGPMTEADAILLRIREAGFETMAQVVMGCADLWSGDHAAAQRIELIGSLKIWQEGGEHEGEQKAPITEIASDDVEAIGTDLGAGLAGLAKTGEKERVRIKEPFLTAGATIDAAFKARATQATMGANWVNALLDRWRRAKQAKADEAARVAREAAAKAARDAEEAQRALEQKGLQATLAEAQAAEQTATAARIAEREVRAAEVETVAAKRTYGQVGMSTSRTIQVLDIFEPKKVPKKWLVPDEKAIKAELLAGRPVAGARLVDETKSYFR